MRGLPGLIALLLLVLCIGSSLCLYQKQNGQCVPVETDTCLNCGGYSFSCWLEGVPVCGVYEPGCLNRTAVLPDIDTPKSCQALMECQFTTSLLQETTVFTVSTCESVLYFYPGKPSTSWARLGRQSATSLMPFGQAFMDSAGNSVIFIGSRNSSTYLTSNGECSYGDSCSSDNGCLSYSAVLTQENPNSDVSASPLVQLEMPRQSSVRLSVEEAQSSVNVMFNRYPSADAVMAREADWDALALDIFLESSHNRPAVLTNQWLYLNEFLVLPGQSGTPMMKFDAMILEQSGTLSASCDVDDQGNAYCRGPINDYFRGDDWEAQKAFSLFD